jgi:hypothetical protein
VIVGASSSVARFALWEVRPTAVMSRDMLNTCLATLFSCWAWWWAGFDGGTGVVGRWPA